MEWHPMGWEKIIAAVYKELMPKMHKESWQLKSKKQKKNPEGIMLSEINKSQKDKKCMILFMWDKLVKLIEQAAE